MAATVQNAQAVPAYSRKHQLKCSQCHSAWPLLNRFGRTFKENGYRLDRVNPVGPGADADVVIDDRLTLAKNLPMSFRLQGRPYAKRNIDPRFRMQVAHEFELQITDSAGGNFSYFANIEAADDEQFTVELADFVGGWHPREQANIVGGYSGMTFTDGYNTFANRRLTQDRPSPNSAGFQSGFRLRDKTPFASFYGRAEGLFYSATVGTGQADTLGADKRDYMVRAVYDLPGGLSLGGFGLVGQRELAGPLRKQDYTRKGADLQFEAKGLTANALWFRAQEDLATTLVRQVNDAWYLQAFYVIPVKAPVVPLVRYESVQSANGGAATRGVHAAMVWYFMDNINVSVEHFRQTHVPPGTAKLNRLSVLFMLAF